MKATYHERCDARLKKGVDKVGIPLDAGLVYGVVAASEGNNARPCDREAVAPHTVLDEEVDVLPPTVVGVGRNVSVPPVERLAGQFREIVPNGLSTSVDVGRALNLEAR